MQLHGAFLLPSCSVALPMAIVKILARHNPAYSGLINYILKEAKVNKDEIYSLNLRSKDIDGYVKEFMEN